MRYVKEELKPGPGEPMYFLIFFRLKKSHVVQFTWQLLQAVHFCHEHNVSSNYAGITHNHDIYSF